MTAVLQVVTLVSPDRAYGGPITVAQNLSEGLRSRGYDVTIAGGYRGHARPPESIGGVPARLWRVGSLGARWGFAGLFSPRLLIWLARSMRRYDVVHVHVARDLVTLPAAMVARLLGRDLYLQPHGMIDESGRISARLLDVLATRRVLAGADAVLCLTSGEGADIAKISPKAVVRLLPNGVPVDEAAVKHAQPAVRPRVVFLARLHPRKRPTAFVAAAVALLRQGVDAEFAIAGPDEGERRHVVEAIARSGHGDRIVLEPPVSPDDVLAYLAAADLYVLPSVDEPFPMTVLEAMSVGTPVVVTDSCGLARGVEHIGAGVVVGESVEELSSAIGHIICDDTRLDQMSSSALTGTREKYGMGGVIDTLEQIYATPRPRGRRGRSRFR
ncbi:glycosyltransferase [Gordonia sp. DT218]|uniref:glycosyltransferase n=1 Tax=Gordonia sp. DT218 TaxID=3416659 RepID=UPI003CEABDCC